MFKVYIGKTFDGDLILVFKKTDRANKAYESGTEVLDNRIHKTLARISSLEAGFFDRYAKLVEQGFEQGWIGKLSQQYKDIKEIVR